jgi:hypothetical protein
MIDRLVSLAEAVPTVSRRKPTCEEPHRRDDAYGGAERQKGHPHRLD